MIQKVQHRATKIIPAIRNLSCENRLIQIELTTLKDRRLRGDHCLKYFIEISRQLYKFFYNRIVISRDKNK
jgi:hypothetical protein